MAYGEKRGRGEYPWRSRYRRPDGTLGSEPGFRTRKAAEDWGEDQEAQIRAGTWRDPELQRTPFGEFARKFMAARQRRSRTMGTRWDLLEQHILPKWEHTPLLAVTWFDVDAWQLRLDVDDSKRGHVVSLMSTIMTAAVDAQYLLVNPLFGRRRTAQPLSLSASTPRKSEEEKAHRPEEVLRVAERLGPAYGLRVITTAWTGLNMGEGTGLHRDNALLTRRQPYDGGVFTCRVLRIVQEVSEGEHRSETGAKLGTRLELEPLKNEYRIRDLDLPPFLDRLWAYHLADWPHPWPLSTPSGKWIRRSNWGRTLRPAADGAPARGRGHGVPDREAWEPIAPGMTLRSLRHTHDTWQDEVGVRPPLAYEQAGHRMPGIKGVYQHPTAPMRIARLEALQELYDQAMATLGWRTMWGRVDLVKPAPQDLLPFPSQLISLRARDDRRRWQRGSSEVG
ncbi:hypothetical protein [Streptomyces phytophilus]|uniref:hypothetical protein n=1 Tax=Streptomyces phytophilus TaxID=722715 RepID=UPI00215DB65D|nr:hypothetical protein [Streptomyces phytophilus]